MGFRESLSQFRMLSELYEVDAPQARLLAEYPSSNSEETFLSNANRYVIHDPFPPPARSLMKVLGPHHLMCGWGNRVPVCSEIAPPDILLEHWRNIWGESGCPQWHAYEPTADYITIYPHESVPADKQVIHPDLLHPLHSKEVISRIDCSQAGVLDSITPPCIVKLSHGYAGLGNYFVRNESDVQATRSEIERLWPGSDLVINEIIEDIIGDFGIQFYLHRDGRVVWLGFTEQKFNEAMRWSGGHFQFSLQDKLYEAFQPIVTATARYLHGQGYFGVVGVDILQNRSDEFFLVDVNPRLTGITPFLIASRIFAEDGLEAGIYRASFEFPGSIEELIARAESMGDFKVVVLAVYHDATQAITKCHLSINGPTIEACESMFSRMASPNAQRPGS